MSAPTFRKVIPGQPLRIPAGDYNAMIEAARAARSRATGDGSPEVFEHYQHAQVYNALSDIGRYKVLSIETPAIDPATNDDGFAERLRLNGTLPAVGDENLAITLEAIPEGFLGRCAVSGIAPALVNVTNALHRAAAPNASIVLQSASRGPVEIVWKPAGISSDPDHPLLCLVRLRGGRPHGDAFAVICNIDGGSAGNATTTCSYTYEVSDLYGVVIGTTKTPEKRRYPQTPYTTTPEDSPGLAYYAADGSLHLFDANEMAETEECPGEALVGDGITFDIAAGIAGTLRELT